MPDPPVTLTTDFGETSPYVPAMKGVLLSVNPAARLVDLSHRIPPQNVAHVNYFLAGCVPFFPAGTLHVVVVDPGVGSERALLYAEAGGQRLLAPDNGCLTATLEALGGPSVVRRLAEPRFWRREVSSTFHGRDILAPTAGHLTLGGDPAELGPVVSEWVRLPSPGFRSEPNGVVAGEVLFVDDFGNLITSIPASAVPSTPVWVRVGSAELADFRFARTYAEAGPGRVAVLFSSDGRLEIAVANGNAAQRLHAAIGTRVTVGFGR